MNVGILTYHFALNYGAALQCYALRKAIVDEGYNCSILNLITSNQERNNSLHNKRKGLKNIAMRFALAPFNESRKIKSKKFNDFSVNYFNLTRRCEDEKGLKNIIDENEISSIVCGSDQVWNPHIEDFTELFFLPFDTNAKKIGYAVSIGGSSFDDLKPYEEEIKRFDSIAVREKSSTKTVNQVGGLAVSETVDPTLLIERKEWDHLAEKSRKKIDEPYMICYFLKKEIFNQEYRFAREIAKKKNLKLYFINQRFSARSFYPNTLFDVGPEDFLSLFKNASCICTDSFHGTLYSLIFNKDFYSLVPTTDYPDTRRQDILSNVGLSRRCVFLDDVKIDYESINYTKVEEEIELLRNRSREFLKVSLNDV